MVLPCWLVIVCGGCLWGIGGGKREAEGVRQNLVCIDCTQSLIYHPLMTVLHLLNVSMGSSVAVGTLFVLSLSLSSSSNKREKREEWGKERRWLRGENFLN